MHGDIQSDSKRDTFLRSQGFNVLRFWNSDVDRNLGGVIERIFGVLNTPPRPRCALPALPTRGRDEG